MAQTTLKQLIDKLTIKLQVYGPDIPVSIEPNISHHDQYLMEDVANKAIDNNLDPITLYVSEAQFRKDPIDEEYIEYGFDDYDNPIDKKQVLIISSPVLNYGAKEDGE